MRPSYLFLFSKNDKSNAALLPARFNPLSLFTSSPVVSVRVALYHTRGRAFQEIDVQSNSIAASLAGALELRTLHLTRPGCGHGQQMRQQVVAPEDANDPVDTQRMFAKDQASLGQPGVHGGTAHLQPFGELYAATDEV